MSDPVESFILYAFGEEPEPVKSVKREEDEFITLFEPAPPEEEDGFGEARSAEGEGKSESEEEYLLLEEEQPAEPEPPEEPAIDIEAETRKIFEEAFTQGEKAGYEMGLQRVEPLAKRLTRHITELEEFRTELTDRAHGLAVELALTFAEAVVLRSMSADKEVVADMVRKALDICEAKSEITIRVRADDAPYIGCESSAFIKILSDDSMREPGFVIETNFGDIDGRISTQLEELKKRVYE